MTQFKLTRKIFILPLFLFVCFSILPTAFISQDIEPPAIAILPNMIVVFFLIIPRVLAYMTTRLELQETKLIGKIGILNSQILDAPLDKINSIYVEQGVFEKILGYGSIVISTSSSNFEFKYISKPNQARSLILSEVEEQKKRDQERQAELIAKAMKNN